MLILLAWQFMRYGAQCKAASEVNYSIIAVIIRKTWNKFKNYSKCYIAYASCVKCKKNKYINRAE
jgi:hypothetical protein